MIHQLCLNFKWSCRHTNTSYLKLIRWLISFNILWLQNIQFLIYFPVVALIILSVSRKYLKYHGVSISFKYCQYHFKLDWFHRFYILHFYHIKNKWTRGPETLVSLLIYQKISENKYSGNLNLWKSKWLVALWTVY